MSEYIKIGSIQIDLTVNRSDDALPGDGMTTKVMRAIEKGIRDSGLVPYGTGVWITRSNGPNTLHCTIFDEKKRRRMTAKQAMRLNVETASPEDLMKAEMVLFRATMKSVASSPIQKKYSVKYWSVRNQRLKIS